MENLDIDYLAGRIGEEIFKALKLASPSNRELFSAMFLQGLLQVNLQKSFMKPQSPRVSEDTLKRTAIQCADNLIEELESTSK